MCNERVSYGDDGSATLFLASTLYSQGAVLSTGYLFTDRCYVSLDQGQDGNLTVQIRLKDASAELGPVIDEFMNALLDQELRSRLAKETDDIQRMIVSEAFSPLDDVKHE